jgi:hypothetical protein
LGAHVWSKRFGNTANDHGFSVAVDSSGNVLVTGSFLRTVDFGGGNLTAGYASIFVAKYSAAGTHIWSKGFMDYGEDAGYAITADTSGNVIVTGVFAGTVDFGGGSLTNAGVSSIFVAKYSAAGTHIWSEQFGNPGGQDVGTGIAVDRSGNTILTGYYSSSLDFGFGSMTSTSASSWDIFLVKFAP